MLFSAHLHSKRIFGALLKKKKTSFLIWSDINDLRVVTGNRLTEAFPSFCRNKFVLQTLVWKICCLLFYKVCQLFAILYSGLNKMWQELAICYI